MKLIVISGAEATCKSAVGKELAKQLNCTYISKDSIKEALFDEMLISTWNFKLYEQKAKDLFFQDIQNFILNKKDVIIESNFIGVDKVKLEKLLNQTVEVTEVHCYTKGYVSFKRFVIRNETGKRHRGHHDRRWYLKVLFQTTMHVASINIGAHRAVGISKRIINLDTTHFPNVNYVGPIQFINK